MRVLRDENGRSFGFFLGFSEFTRISDFFPITKMTMPLILGVKGVPEIVLGLFVVLPNRSQIPLPTFVFRNFFFSNLNFIKYSTRKNREKWCSTKISSRMTLPLYRSSMPKSMNPMASLVKFPGLFLSLPLLSSLPRPSYSLPFPSSLPFSPFSLFPLAYSLQGLVSVKLRATLDKQIAE
jgi:hypothetical protein